MSYKVVPTPTFLSRLKRLETKYPTILNGVNHLIALLENGFLFGEKIPGTRGVRKVRLENVDSQKGKSGGYRILYLFISEDGKIYLLTIYSKSEREDMSSKEISKLLRELGLR